MGDASPIWNPSKITQVKQIEQVQRNAARWVMNQPYSPHNPSSVTEMLNRLKSHPGSGSDRTIASVRQVAALVMLYIGWLVTCGIDYSFTP